MDAQPTGVREQPGRDARAEARPAAAAPIISGVMSFSLVFTPYNIPPFAPKQARRSKLDNVTPVKNEPNANVCSANQISVAISHGSGWSDADGRDQKRIRQSHLIAGERQTAGALQQKAAFLKDIRMQMSVITSSPSSTPPGLITLNLEYKYPPFRPSGETADRR